MAAVNELSSLFCTTWSTQSEDQVGDERDQDLCSLQQKNIPAAGSLQRQDIMTWVLGSEFPTMGGASTADR